MHTWEPGGGGGRGGGGVGGGGGGESAPLSLCPQEMVPQSGCIVVKAQLQSGGAPDRGLDVACRF